MIKMPPVADNRRMGEITKKEGTLNAPGGRKSHYAGYFLLE